MSRTLGFYPFITGIITVTAIVVICSFNMYVLTGHRKSYFTALIYITSFFAVSWLFFRMMSSAVFVLPLSLVYHQLARLSLMLMGAGIIAGLIIIFALGRRRSYRHLSPNILKALSGIDDIVFVVDQEGEISHINHPGEYASLFGSIERLDRLVSFVEANCSARWEHGREPDTTQGTALCELMFQGTETHYLLEIAPIVLDDGSRLGYTAVLEDVTTVKNSEKLLQARNEDLELANERLANYVRVAGALDAEKERLQILEHIQTTLIDDIEKALFNLGKAKQSCFRDGSYPSVMRNVATELREVYSTVRHAVSSIAGKEV